jgi:hypothetical protein
MTFDPKKKLDRFFRFIGCDDKKVISYSGPMNLRKKAAETFDSVAEASEKVVDTTEWATVALIGVAALSLLGLAIGVVALSRTATIPTRES